MSALATPEGTAAYAKAHPAAPGHYRAWRGLSLSSLGFGTYLGEATDAADEAYAAALEAGLRGGVNVLDTAAIYRGRRSERVLGRALRASGVPREQVLVTTKGGFATPDDLRAYLREGVLAPEDVAMGAHAMTPAFLARELDRSLDALGLPAVDVYFLHNPEAQRERRGEEPFLDALRPALAFLEQARREGRIGAYGLATWFGLREPPESPRHLPLARILDLAREVGGEEHGLRALELPYNPVMPEAARVPSQPWRGRRAPVLDVARDAGLLVLGSATLMQGRVLGTMTPLDAIQFSRGSPGMTTALVGTGRPEHARENLRALRAEPPRGAPAG